MRSGPRADIDPSAEGTDVFFEIVTVGTYAKVSAIDSVSGLEVSIMGPAHADRRSLEAAALSKLQYMLKKKKKKPRGIVV